VAHHIVHWQQDGRTRSARWAASSRHPVPDTIIVAGDALRAGHALRLTRKNHAILWRGDYRNARQLLAAMARRLDGRAIHHGGTPADIFHRHRQARGRRAQLLNRVLVELGPDYTLDLPHAPVVSHAYQQAHGSCVLSPAPGTSPALGTADGCSGRPAARDASCHVHDPDGDNLVLPLPELLGVLGAHQWRVRGIRVPALGTTIHPHYGVFAPTRQEYVDLVADAPWPRVTTAFDIGTGTGVLAALLAQRGAERVVATDIELRAVACARDNIHRLGLADRIRVEHRDLFPSGRADLIVCNPPWLPAEPTSSLEAAVYDPGARMLRRFVHEIPHRLTPGGEAWLILSDLAERLGLRHEPTGMFTEAGLTVAGRYDSRPRHRTRRRGDPLSEHRAAEITSLWRLTRAVGGR
jgi:SAM-dependent methyltransferase